MKRLRVLQLSGLLLLLAAAITAGAGLWLSRWIPVHGKAWIETQLEHALPLDITIGRLRYSFWDGLIIEELHGLPRDGSAALRLDMPSLRLRVGLLRLALRQEVAFRLFGTLQTPVATTLTMAGSYQWRARRLAVRLTADDVTWAQPPLRLRTDLQLDGTAQGSVSHEPWRYDFTVELRDGRLTGVASVPEISELAGTMRLTPDHVQLMPLTGRALDSAWTLQGDLVNFHDPIVDALLETRVTLASLPITAVTAWQPSGHGDVRAMVRGPLRAWPNLELMAEADLADASLTIPAWKMRAERLRGHLTYDHLTRRLTVQPLAADVPHAHLIAEGDAVLQQHPSLNLRLHADGEALALASWPLLAPMASHLHGPLAVEATVQGTVPQLRWDVAAALHVDGQPVQLAGVIAREAETTPLRVTAAFADGSLELHGAWQPDRFRIDRADAAVGATRLTLKGFIHAQPAQASRLTLAGVVDPSDLARLPWLKLPALEQWNMYGPATVTLEATGPLQDWRAATAQGSVRAEQLTIRELPVRAVNIDVTQADGQLSVRLLQAFVADGKLVGRYVLDSTRQPPETALELDLTQADLTQLAAAIPTWRQRGIEGTASGHLRVLGPWSRRAQLVGDGWLHANGAHLADVPFLEKVLKGFFGIFAQRLGLGAFRKAEITQMSAQWTLSNDRLSTDDLRFGGVTGTEPITIVMRGSVGLDKTLDLTVEPDFSEQLLLESSAVPSATRALLQTVGRLDQLRRLIGRYRLTGTLDKPEPRFEFSPNEIWSQLLRGGLGLF